MAKITTEDCKNFLVEHFSKLNTNTQAKDWKRTAKYKDDNKIVIRDFSHPVIGFISLQENNGNISIYNGQHKAKTNDFVLTVFNDEYKQKGFELVDEFLKLINSEDTYEEPDIIKKTDDWVKYSVAIPSRFTFFFPEEIYENDDDSIKALKKGLDSSMLNSDGGSLCITFNDKLGQDYDERAQDVLRYLLPDFLSFMDEYHVDLSLDKDMTIREVISYLLKMGFEYVPVNLDNDRCCFSDLMEEESIITEQFNLKEEKHLEKENILRLEKIILNDDEVSLEKELNNGLSLNKILSEKSLFSFACFEQSKKCMKLLLNKGVNLFDNAENNDEINLGSIYSLIYKPEEFKEILDLIIRNVKSKEVPKDKIGSIYKAIYRIIRSKNIMGELFDYVIDSYSEQEKINEITSNYHAYSLLKRLPEWKLNVNHADSEVVKQLITNNIDNHEDLKTIVYALDPKKHNLKNELVNNIPILTYFKDLKKVLEDEYKYESQKAFQIIHVRNGVRESTSDKLSQKISILSVVIVAISSNINRGNIKPSI